MHHHHIPNCIQYYSARDRMTVEFAEIGLLIDRLISFNPSAICITNRKSVSNLVSCGRPTMLLPVGEKADKEIILC